MAIFFALLAFFSWGLADVLAAFASRRSGSILTFFWALVLPFIFTSIFVPFGGGISDINLFVLVILISFINQTGTLFFLKGIELGNATLVITIAGSFALVTVLISLFYFGEKILPIQMIGIFLVFIGIILASLRFEELKDKKLGKIFSDKGVIYALIAFLGWGIYYAFIGRAVAKIGLFWSYYPLNLFFVVLIFFKEVQHKAWSLIKDIKALIFAVVGIFSFYIGVGKGLTSIVAPIASASPVLSVILTRIIFKEKLTGQQKIGIVSSLAGIVLISFS